MKVTFTYHANYNGAGLWLNDDEDTTDHPLVEVVTNYAYKRCDKDGQFQGDVDKLEKFAHKLVKRHYGKNVEFVFEFDTRST